MSRLLAAAALAAVLAAPVRARAGSSPTDTTSTAIMAGAAALLVGWDVYLATQHAHTESSMLKEAGWNANVLPYSLGMLLGHWFLNRQPDAPRDARSQWTLVLGSVAAVAAWDVAWHLSHGSDWRGPPGGAPIVRHPGIWAGLGFAAGGLVWSQEW